MAFEVASVCLKAGAKRFGAPERKVMQQKTQVQEQTQTEEHPKVFVNNRPISSQPKQKQVVSQQPVLQSDVPLHESQIPADESKSEASASETPASPPSDWLKPKIFKSSSLL